DQWTMPRFPPSGRPCAMTARTEPALGRWCGSTRGALGADLQFPERDVTVDLWLFRQSEHSLADDVALHLVGTASDARRGCGQDAERPARPARVLPCLAAGACDGDAEIRGTAGEQRTGELGNGPLGARRLTRRDRGTGALSD